MFGLPGAFASLAGTLLAFIVTPDLDQDGGTISDYWVRKWFGIIAGFFWRALWYPYAKLVPHRHPISHWPILGTAIRLCYLGIFLWIIGLDFESVNKPELYLPFFWAICTADMFHWVEDFIGEL